MKQCEICGNEIPWAKDDYAKRYATKRFCSRACQGAGLSADITRVVDDNGCLTCSRCMIVKPTSEFYVNAAYACGYSSRCKACQRDEIRDSKNRNRDTHRQRRNLWGQNSKEKLKAHKAVKAAIIRGELPALSDALCARCFEPAKNYHHPSYRENDRLNVIPLCHDCHRKVHAHSEIAAEVERGVVITSVGMVRIAIASNP